MTRVNALSAFADSIDFARRLGRAARLPCFPITQHTFPDGETLVRVRAPAPRHVALVRSLHHPNAKVFDTLLAADALRRAGAKELTLVAPFLAYMRQDARFAPGQPISQRVLGGVLGRAFDRILTVEAHLHRVPRLALVTNRRSRSLSAAPLIAAWMRRHAPAAVVVGPDEESEPWVRAIARLAERPWTVGTKRRRGDRRVDIVFKQLPPYPAAVVVDDIASTGETLAAATRTLRRAGIRAVDTVVVHALFAPGALGRVRAAGARRVVSGDTVPHRTNGLRCADLFVEALHG